MSRNETQNYKIFIKNFNRFQKGPVKLIKPVKIVHSFLVCVKSIPSYHFRLGYAVLQMAVKEFFETLFYKWKINRFNLSFTYTVILADL